MKTNPYYLQRVNDPSELRRFAQNYFNVSGNVLEVEFLAKAIVYQMYFGPFPVAGFVLNTVEMNDPLRTISYLDQRVARQMMVYEDLSEMTMLEISANYRIKTLGMRRTMLFYAIMLNKAHDYAQQLNKTYILASSVVKALQLVHQMLLTRTVYFGPISADRQAAVKGDLPLLKVYVSRVQGFRFRSILALVNLFLVRTRKKPAEPAPTQIQEPAVAPQPLDQELVS